MLCLLFFPLLFTWLAFKHVDSSKSKRALEIDKEEEVFTIDETANKAMRISRYKTRLIKYQKELFGLFHLKKTAQAYHLVFLVRRYAMILILMLLPGNFLPQILSHLSLTTIVISYLATNLPYQNRYLSYKEIVNEILVALAAYPLWTFSDWVNEEQERIYAGWFLIAIILVIILFNFLCLAFSQSRLLYTKVKRWSAKRKLEKTLRPIKDPKNKQRVDSVNVNH